MTITHVSNFLEGIEKNDGEEMRKQCDQIVSELEKSSDRIDPFWVRQRARQLLSHSPTRDNVLLASARFNCTQD